MKVISFIQPSRNNLKYLKWSYNSIRKNLGYIHEICWADDFSDDGTWEWMNEMKEKDPNVKIYRNEGPNRLGHTILYDTLVDMASNTKLPKFFLILLYDHLRYFKLFRDGCIKLITFI
jgi:glycosyltransferase involved in cell wall biosynthesis